MQPISDKTSLVRLCYLSPLKGVCHEILDLNFFHDSNPSGPLKNRVFSNSVSISPRYSITKFEKFDSEVCMTPRSQILD